MSHIPSRQLTLSKEETEISRADMITLDKRAWGPESPPLHSFINTVELWQQSNQWSCRVHERRVSLKTSSICHIRELRGMFPSSVPLQTQWSRLSRAQNTMGHTEQWGRLFTQYPQRCLMNNIQVWTKDNRYSSTNPNINQQFSKTLLSKIVPIFLTSCFPSDSQPLHILQNKT